MSISYDDQETIAAISTPPGTGGIGVIRISGPQSLPVLQSLFVPHNPSCSYRSHQMYYGEIFTRDGQRLDEILAVYMRAPKSYTCEDVVELHCHGSFLVLQTVLELTISYGVKLAQAGEFTKRAFLNGRIDLTKAEAVIDILSAKTRKGIDLAQEQLSGSLYKRIEPIRKSLAHIRALLEVAIDFPDEDIDIVNFQELSARMTADVVLPITRLLEGADRGRIYREGILLVIAGLPNVGKSSLLNTILQEERALVTAVAGTTRDSIEELVDIQGMPVRIVDTAGIRQQAGEVETLGIQRALDLINAADLVMYMVDGAGGVSDADRQLYQDLKHKPMVAVANKLDLIDGDDGISSLDDLLSFIPAEIPKLAISAKKQQGIEELKSAIFHTVTGSDTQWEEDGCAPNLRHKEALRLAIEAANRIVEGIAINLLSSDLIAVDVQECLDQLGDIVGETTTEDVLDIIFEQFCLGK